MKNLTRSTIRSIALTLVAPTAGFLLVFLIEIFLQTELTKLLSSLVNLLVVAPIAFLLFPQRLGIPFGRIDTRTFLQRVGFYLPEGAGKHFLLGLILAGCTLSGMLIASILTGEYVMDPSNINLPHLIFSLNPAIWEELFYRGVLMILLLKFTRSLKAAFVIQVILFGLAHIKGFSFWAFVDVFSVMVLAVGYTFVAYQTRVLVAGILWHYFHDALLFFVQIPSSVSTNASENVVFYGLLWLMVGVGCGITWLAANKFGVRASQELYRY